MNPPLMLKIVSASPPKKLKDELCLDESRETAKLEEEVRLSLVGPDAGPIPTGKHKLSILNKTQRTQQSLQGVGSYTYNSHLLSSLFPLPSSSLPSSSLSTGPQAFARAVAIPFCANLARTNFLPLLPPLLPSHAASKVTHSILRNSKLGAARGHVDTAHDFV